MQKLSSPFELIKKSVDIFIKKENFLFLVKIYWPLAIFSVLSAVQGLSKIPSSLVNSPWFLGMTVIIQVLYLFVSVLITAAGIIALGKIIEGKEFSAKDIFLTAKKSYWTFFLLSITLSVIYTFGFVLLIIPGVLFVVWFAFSKFIMIEKDMKIKESLLKSKAMVKGNYWKILGRLIIFGLFMIIVQMAVGIIPFGIGSVLVSLCGALFMLPVYLLYRELQS